MPQSFVVAMGAANLAWAVFCGIGILEWRSIDALTNHRLAGQ